MDNKENMYTYLKNELGAEPVQFPESLSEENIKALLDSQPKLTAVKPKRGRRVAAVLSAAAVFCLCVLGAWSAQNRMPATELADPAAPSQNVGGAQTPTVSEIDFLADAVGYADILALANTYAEKNSYEYKDVYYTYNSSNGGLGSVIEEFFGSIGTKNEADMVVQEDMAVADTTVAAAQNSAVPEAAPESVKGSADDSLRDGVSAGETTGSAEKPDHGKTNIQVEGVDEADILKNDGENLYLLKGNTLHVIRAYPAENMQEIAVVTLKDQFDGELINYYYSNEMFLYNNYLCVVLTCWYENHSNARTMVLVYDVTDPANPVFVQRYGQDGNYLSSRITGGKLVLVTTHNGFYTYEYTDNAQTCIVLEDKLIPKVYVGAQDGVAVAENALSVVDESSPTAFTVASLINMDDLSQPISSQAVLGGGTEVYCTNENLFVARVAYKSFEPVPEDTADDSLRIAVLNQAVSQCTQIYSFTFADGEMKKKANGTVPGAPLNQFSMDEYNGYFRIAVTFGDSNGLYVLDSDLNIVGECERYGENEIIRSVRFMGDWGYVVTFEQTDPLFVIDLSDPTKPVITGEVKLPGFSAYLHPIGNGLLLGMGYGGTEDGLDGSAKISLFDVSDPMNPKELDALVHENANLSTDHKAFCTVGDGSFLLPMYSFDTVTDEYGYEVWTTDCGAVLHFAVENGKLVVRNEFFCDELYTDPNRATYIGDVAYAVSIYHTPNVYAFDMNSGELLATAECSEPNVEYYTSGWKHYEDTVLEKYEKDDGEKVVVYTTPAYNPQAGGIVTGTTAGPVEEPEITTASPAYAPVDSSAEIAPETEIALEYAVSDPTKAVE
ncbi:MAG: beta-propeller domain-containing protein [Clostridia bacterium]|nr:beta-propeller domain-containing protein [Clostridia bacterium]